MSYITLGRACLLTEEFPFRLCVYIVGLEVWAYNSVWAGTLKILFLLVYVVRFFISACLVSLVLCSWVLRARYGLVELRQPNYWAAERQPFAFGKILWALSK